MRTGCYQVITESFPVALKRLVRKYAKKTVAWMAPSFSPWIEIIIDLNKT